MSYIEELRKAIRRLHGVEASHVETVPVKETRGDATVWEGVVHAFDLDDHPTATRAYAWSSPIEGSDKRRFLAEQGNRR